MSPTPQFLTMSIQPVSFVLVTLLAVMAINAAAEQPTEQAPTEQASTHQAPAEQASASESIADRWITSIAVLPGGDGDVVAATAGGLLMRPADVIRIRPGRAEPSDAGAFEVLYQHPAAVWQVAVSADAATIGSVDYKGNLVTYDIAAATATTHDKAFARWCQAFVAAPDGKFLAGNEAGQLMAWNVATKQVVQTVQVDSHSITDIAVAPGGTQIAVADGGGHIHLLSYPELTPLFQIDVSADTAWSVVYAGGGDRLYVGCGDRKLYRVAAQADAKPTEVMAAGDWVTQLAIGPDGTIAAGDLAGTVHLLRDADAAPAVSTTLQAGSGVWAVLWDAAANRLLIGTRKNGMSVATRSWSLQP